MFPGRTTDCLNCQLQPEWQFAMYTVPGLHTIRITGDGLQAFSRTFGFVERKAKSTKRRLLSIGIPELDRMMGGRIA